MSSREVGNWLKGYQEYTRESESPEMFHLWTALSIIASAVRRNVWVDQGIFTLYPNMYVILVGPPGKVSKSTTIRMGRRLLLGVEDIVFGPDSITREELIRQMAKVGGVAKQAALTIHSSELSSLIEPSGIKMIQFLTDIYDGDFKWRYSTKGQGRDTINNPVLNILAGTTPSWIAEGLPSDVVGHGFTSRVVFVYEEEPRFLNPRPSEPDEVLVEALINDLRHIASLEGEFTMTSGADAAYDKYYRAVYKGAPKDYRIEGYYWRKAKAHLLKVAMLVSIAERDTLVITETDIITAWNLLGAIEESMHKTFSAVGKYEHASDLDRIYKQILENGKMSSAEIHERNYAVGDVEQLARILTMLMQMGRIEKVREGSVVYFKVKKGGG